MTMTPHLIAEFLLPWVLAGLAFPILFLSVRCIAVCGPRVLEALMTGQPPYPAPDAAVRRTNRTRRPFAGKDVESAVMLAAAAWGLALAIDDVRPPPQWWAESLTSAWEVGFGFATVVMAAVGVLLKLMVMLLAVLAGLALLSWLAEPVDDEPRSPNRVQWLWRGAVASWNTYRRGREPADEERA